MASSLILASQSSARRAMLSQSGLDFSVKAAPIDEAAIKSALLAEDAKPEEVADTLAEYKARKIADQNPEAFVIGSDQVLVFGKEILSKAKSLQEAEETLKKLRGQAHTLISAAVVYHEGKPIWRGQGRAQMIMRPFSDGFLTAYLEKHGTRLCQSVGCYFFEEDGVNLFSRVQGDYYSVLGLPLLDLLGSLRNHGFGLE